MRTVCKEIILTLEETNLILSGLKNKKQSDQISDERLLELYELNCRDIFLELNELFVEITDINSKNNNETKFGYAFELNLDFPLDVSEDTSRKKIYCSHDLPIESCVFCSFKQFKSKKEQD